MAFQIVEIEETRCFLADVLPRVVSLVGKHGLEVGLQTQAKSLEFP